MPPPRCCSAGVAKVGDGGGLLPGTAAGTERQPAGAALLDLFTPHITGSTLLPTLFTPTRKCR
ncbi:MAG: hypothetical protein IPJ27_04005 [Candidatus Accumulibacter sp.]|uniref:Uncharacterized protein n=1 Tax=Candidatus Accumulibacter proximus TaxID=2954385 RepID=A0A935PXZ1_9PROT|nr:hypothetical protein [Candidatus Accumulibacter proximus]